MIDQATIDKIYDAIQIIDVVGDFVSLKRRGANYLGHCPFHNEKTPSFTVSASKGIYKCFGCGKGGNGVTFIMEHENLSYYDALRYLAKKYNIPIVEKELSPEEAAQRTEREALLVVTDFAAKFFRKTLNNHQEGIAVGKAYFRERGIRDDMIEKFQLGFSPTQRDALLNEALRAGYQLEHLIKAGLVAEKDNYRYDKFAGRVIFPILSISGQVIAFGGRTLRTDKNVAKYLNSPESEIYHKSNVLYGLFQAKKAIEQQDKCFMTEGYTDVISMHQVGIENVVASSGTSLTINQIRLIKRFTNNLTVLYDGDMAGIKAALRGIDLILEQGMNVRVLLLPDGEDPDSFSKKHSASEVLDFIAKNESDFVLFKTKLLLDEAKNDPIKRATLIADIISSIAIIPNNIVRSEYIKECAHILHTDEAVLYTEVMRVRRKKTEGNIAAPSPIVIEEKRTDKPLNQTNEFEFLEREIIRLLLNYGNHILFEQTEIKGKQKQVHIVTVDHYIIDEIRKDELELQHPIYRQIFEEYEINCLKNPEDATAYFLRHQDKEVHQVVADLLTKKYNLSKKLFARGAHLVIETEESKLPDLVRSVITEFKNKKVISFIKQIKLQLLEAQEKEDVDRIIALQEQMQQLNILKKAFAETLGNRIIIK
ncbi:MAG TPA: DNA primase [Bacteroidales bacterium]